MDVIVTGRHCTVSPDLRERVAERLSTIEKLRDRVIRVDVEFTAAENKGGDPEQSMQSQITLRSKGPVVRAEASAEDKMAAFEKSLDKLMAQLRRAADRRKARRGLRPVPADLPPRMPEDLAEEVPTRVVAGVEVTGDGPLVVREKMFTTSPLTLAQALDEMELVGHDFFLYVDAETERPVSSTAARPTTTA